MNRNEMQSRLTDLMKITGRNRTLAQWHEILQLCEDLGNDSTWGSVKHDMEYWQQRKLKERQK